MPGVKACCRQLLLTSLLSFGLPSLAHAHPLTLTPDAWPVAAREAAQRSEATSMRATASRGYEGREGAISAIASPIAVEAGLETLRRGGTAADAATAIAMTQVTTQLGSVVSFAGIMSMVYYDKASNKVYSLDAGYNSYRGETDPGSIPVADMGSLSSEHRAGTAGGGNLPGVVPETDRHDLGRETLVPGFMAGFEAMHARFGRLPWASMFDPAIWYAEHGVTLSPELAGFFKWRSNFLRKTPEGAAFLAQAGDALPNAGDRFVQPALARTLRAVAAQGAAYMYKGDWAKHFVAIVQREGGKVTLDDLTSYAVTWSEPFSTRFAGATVYAPGDPSYAGYNIIPSLNLAEALGLERKPPYWTDPAAFVSLTELAQFMEGAPQLNDAARAQLTAKGIDVSPAAQLSKDFARKAAPLMAGVFVPASGDDHHSNSLVVVDRFGNVAAITHTINSVVWGSTGIVVDGIPIPDSAGFQQARLKTLAPGARLPNEMIQTIALRDGKPVLATAGIGAALIPESLKIVLGVLGQGRSLAEVQAAPPLLTNFALGGDGKPGEPLRVAVPQGAYSADFLAAVKAAGLAPGEIPQKTSAGLRGTVVAVTIDPATHMLSTVDTAGTLIFGGAY